VRAVDARGDHGVVEIDLVTSNQRGEPVVTGSATAALPR
jgi:acyl dehydratase